MGKKRGPLALSSMQWEVLVSDPASLQALLQEPGRRVDLVRAITGALQHGGVLNTADTGLRLRVLDLVEQQAVELCSEAPTDAVRALYEAARDRAVVRARDGPAAPRVQQAALHAITQLLVKLEMQQRDARLVKVHVELLFRIMERSGPHADAAPELCRCAATCLRLLEEGAPTLLLAGGKQLLELARRESGVAAESYALLAARVLANGAARCLDGQQALAEAERARTPAASGVPLLARATSSEEEERDVEHDHLAYLEAVDVRSVSLGGGVDAAAAESGSDAEAAAPLGARDISPVGTLDALAQGMTAFASDRTAASSEDLSSPKEAPGSPRGVASLLGTASTSDVSARSMLLQAQQAHVDLLARKTSMAASEISGSVQLDSGAAVALLAPGGPGLRPFRVPQHLAWPDALAQDALSVYLTPDACEDLRRACLEFLAALPKMGVQGVAGITAALPPLMRAAPLPPEQLAPELDALLHSGSTLMLQAVLKLYSEVPEGLGDWRERLTDSVLHMVNGPHPAEQRLVAAAWCLVQHHAALHARHASLFAGGWRQLLPRADEPPQLLSLKVKALSACLAVGIGRPEEICPMVFAWDGFWQARPSDQQQRLATYALRMLASAAASYAAASVPADNGKPGRAVPARTLSAGGARVDSAAAEARLPPTPHFTRACLVSACLQLLATRPQYLPAVEAFLASCGGQYAGLQLALLNALDALLSAAATGTFACLLPPPGTVAGGTHGRRRGSASAAPAGGSGEAAMSGLGGMLRGLARSMSRKLSGSERATSPASLPSVPASSRHSSPAAAALAAATSQPASPRAANMSPAPQQPSPFSLAAPSPPWPLSCADEAEAWLWNSRTWVALSTHLLQHDLLAYRVLLLRLAQAGAAALPMGALRALAAYASQYHGEQPGHALPAKEAGNAVLAICQAAAMTHLLIGPAGAPVQPPSAGASHRAAPGANAPAPPSGKGRFMRGRTRARSDGGSGGSGGQSVRGGSPGAHSVRSGLSAEDMQWTLQQEEVAAAMQAVLSALTSHFPVESVRRRAQSFLDLLANPSAWDLRLRMGTMAKMLGGYFSDAVSIASYL